LAANEAARKKAPPTRSKPTMRRRMRLANREREQKGEPTSRKPNDGIDRYEQQMSFAFDNE
jgi:hypothetical protein